MIESKLSGHCGTCRSFNAYGGGSNSGECRRYAPRIVDAMSTTAVFPVISDFQWCSEYLPRGEGRDNG